LIILLSLAVQVEALHTQVPVLAAVAAVVLADMSQVLGQGRWRHMVFL
jgi:hypothetical protein